MSTQTRRCFLQSMAAAMSVAVVGIKPNLSAIERPVIDYSLFVDDYRYFARYDLRSPFSIDGAIYACDARIIVTHPGEWSGKSCAKLPDLRILPWDEFDRPGWSPLATSRVKSKGGGCCPLCRSRGVLGDNLSECEECQGTGKCYPDHYEYTGRSLPCPKCILGYVGGVKCSCDAGAVDWRYEFGGSEYNPQYIAAIETLGPVDARVTPDGILLFRGAGDVRGMLMRMRKDDEPET